MTDLTTKLTEASAAAIRRLMPAIEADPANVQLITIELQVAGGTAVKGGMAWIQKRYGAKDLAPPGEGRG